MESTQYPEENNVRNSANYVYFQQWQLIMYFKVAPITNPERLLITPYREINLTASESRAQP
jgi:hypothetical protein